MMAGMAAQVSTLLMFGRLPQKDRDGRGRADAHRAGRGGLRGRMSAVSSPHTKRAGADAEFESKSNPFLKRFLRAAR